MFVVEDAKVSRSQNERPIDLSCDAQRWLRMIYRVRLSQR
jgi:hypothetical protein